MKLAELNAFFWHVRRDGSADRVSTATGANAVCFDCPCGAGHMLSIGFENPIGATRVLDKLLGGVRWTRSGETLDTLTLTPSVHVTFPCGWHGWVTNGEVRPA